MLRWSRNWLSCIGVSCIGVFCAGLLCAGAFCALYLCGPALADTTDQGWLPKPNSCQLGYRLPPGRETQVQAALDTFNAEPAPSHPLVASGAQLAQHDIRIWLAPRDQPNQAPATMAALVVPVACAPATAPHTGSFALMPAGQVDPVSLQSLLAALQTHVKGEVFGQPEKAPPVQTAPTLAALSGERRTQAPRPDDVDRTTVRATFAVLGLGYAIVLLAWLVDRWKRRRAPTAQPPLFTVRLHYRRHHLIPFALQGAIYLYWAAYFPAVIDRAGWIATQIVIAYLVDGLFLLWREREFHLGFAPIPVVGSLNLFLWSQPGHAWVSVLAIVVAFGAKALIRRGRAHVMNPSALGAAVVGLLTLFQPPQTMYMDIAHQFALPPHMTGLILSLVLLPQSLLPIVLTSFGAMLAMSPWSGAGLEPMWPPGLLSIALLITDPMTLPKLPTARLLTGVGYGVLLGLMGLVLLHFGKTDYFIKVWPVPILNLLAPRFDALAVRMSTWRWTAWLPRWLDVSWNRRHMLAFQLVGLYSLWRVGLPL